MYSPFPLVLVELCAPLMIPLNLSFPLKRSCLPLIILFAPTLKVVSLKLSGPLEMEIFAPSPRFLFCVLILYDVVVVNKSNFDVVVVVNIPFYC